jgi:kynurenine formamidase
MKLRIQFVSVLAALTGLGLAAPSFAGDGNWYPSKWGAEDEIGALNELKPQHVVAAASLVKTGKVYSLGIEVNKDTPAYQHRNFRLLLTQPGQQGGKTAGPNKFSLNDEHIEGWLGLGTQINGLGHIGIDHVYYNGHKAADFAEISGVKKLGIEKLPPIVTRGVLLDMTAYFGTEIVKEGTAFSRAVIEDAANKQGVVLQRGDVVIFYTGWLRLIGKDNRRFLTGEPGINLEGAQYLVDAGVVAIGADTWALEVVPFEPGTGLHPVNQLLLAKSGVHVLENINGAELARDKSYEFLFVLGHPKFAGATQSIVNP